MNEQPRPLRPTVLPLRGAHLIEASAGTGKTYNITRIYLRMLLHRRVGVESILVMTFTRAATEELRRRIADELRAALAGWPRLIEEDPFYRELAAALPDEEGDPGEAARARLRNALLLLDEAPIHTLHGFCKRVLTERAFDSGIAFDLEMESDTRELALESVRDAYRRLARAQPDAYARLSQRWPTPEDFQREFAPLIQNHRPLESDTPEAVEARWQERRRALDAGLRANEDTILAALVDAHKQREQRLTEWRALREWLDAPELKPLPAEGRRFLHGGRTRSLPEIRALLKTVKDFADELEPGRQYQRQLDDARLGAIVGAEIEWIRAHFDAARKRQRSMGFDDLVEHLAACLRDDPGGRLAARLRERYPVALVDEFQDTDPQQYAILRALYGGDHDTALYMIGDPKQAIYAFRGGDVFAYLEARDDAASQWYMDTNWRSTSAMIAAVNALFARAAEAGSEILGPGIRYLPVSPSPRADEQPLHDPGRHGALCLAWLPDRDQRHHRKNGITQDFRPHIAAWCASEIDRLLRAARIGENPLRAADIAVLVRDGEEAAQMQQALRDIGHASVYLSTRERVFASVEAEELLRALRGILHPDDPRLFVAALASDFLAVDSETLHRLQGDDELFAHWRNRLLELHDAWLRHGFIAMAMDMIHTHMRPAPQRHERALTNAIHLVELLQRASQRHRRPEQLLAWFQERIDAGDASEEAELRLESDANLIRVLTQHGAKGLEYPVVFVPFPTRYKDPLKAGARWRFVLSHHDPVGHAPLTRLAPDNRTRALARAEAEAESARLLYVAVTRARHRCVLCATPFAGHGRSPLGRVLGLPGDADGKGEALRQALADLADDDGIELFEADTALPIAVSDNRPEPPSPAIATSEFHGHIDRDWWLASFSALSRDLRHGGAALADRDQDDSGPPPDATELRFAMPRGVDTGNLLHAILERIDFPQPDWRTQLRAPLYRFGALPAGHREEELIAWLEDCLQAPLGDGACLAHLERADTLRETGFYFPMRDASRERLAALLAAHRGAPARLPGPARLKGMMQGYIDLIYRWRGRYYVADYKSSHLGARRGDYHHQALRRHLRDNYYDLQYLLYGLALHRHLRARLTDYDPARHFGGVRYLYLRGMAGGDDLGVLSVELEPALLDTLDTLFDGTETVTAGEPR